MALPDHSQTFPSLTQARQDLNTAMTVADAHGRVQYAHVAKDAAAAVAVDPGSSREEKAAARDLMVKAMGITGELTKLHPARQAEIPAQSRGVEID